MTITSCLKPFLLGQECEIKYIPGKPGVAKDQGHLTVQWAIVIKGTRDIIGVRNGKLTASECKLKSDNLLLVQMHCMCQRTRKEPLLSELHLVTSNMYSTHIHIDSVLSLFHPLCPSVFRSVNLKNEFNIPSWSPWAFFCIASIEAG